MKENIEEDIKIVEKLIKTMEQDRITFKDEQTKEIYAYFITALEHILSDYKRVLKENEELKERWDKDTHKLQNDLDIANAKRIDWEKAYQEEKDKQFELVRENQKLQDENEKLKEAVEIYKEQVETKIDAYIDNNYLPKQKIKDKIEELKKERMLKYEFYMGYKIESREQQDIDKAINVLQDLLEEKGE